MYFLHGVIIVFIFFEVATSTFWNLKKRNGVSLKRPDSQESGFCLSSCIPTKAFQLSTTDDPSILEVEDIISDLIESPEQLAQEVSVYLTILLLGELSTDKYVDGCDFVNLINAVVEYERTGNPRPIKIPLLNVVKRLEIYIDVITAVVKLGRPLRSRPRRTKPCMLSRGNQLNETWQLLNSLVDYDYSADVLQDLQASAVRLATSRCYLSNSLGAAISASGPLVYLNVLNEPLVPLVEFIKAVSACGGDVVKKAIAAKQALTWSFNRICAAIKAA